jgi:predicted phosphodiesterase
MEMYPKSLDNFIDLMQETGVHLALHGHWHISESYKLGSLRVVNSGGTMDEGWNVIDCDDR